MICYFCQAEIGYPVNCRLFCPHHHDVEVVHIYRELTKMLFLVTFYVYIRKDTFQIALRPQDDYSEIYKFDDYNSLHVLIKRFGHLLNINPENAVEKIKTILVFS